MIIASSLSWVARVLPEEARDEVCFPQGLRPISPAPSCPTAGPSGFPAAGGAPASGL